MRIELRSINADELGFATYGNTARAAHSGSIDHDGVERSFRRDIVFGSCQGDELHHDCRSDSDAFVYRLAVDHFFDTYGHDALFAHRAIVSHDDKFIGPLREFLFQNDEVFVTRGEDSNDFVSCFLECFGDRQHRRSAYATAGTNDRSVFLDTCCATERSDDVM